jgi:2-(1,2-epoxy-1,2-dihydrophenyl)acetyl-CoA isomerase
MTVTMRTDLDGRLARVAFERKERLNAFDISLMRELEEGLREALKERPAPRAITIETGGPPFSAGGDLSCGAESLAALATQFHVVMELIEDAPMPVVTVVEGIAAGGGFALAIAGDCRIGTTLSRFRIGYGRAGLSVDGGISWRLPRLVGLAQAQRLLYEDPDIGPEEALKLGLLHQVVDTWDVQKALRMFVERLELQSPLSVARNKRLLRAGLDGPLADALRREQAGIAEGAAGADGREGIAAFIGKRKPEWGRGEI